jgi:hypothetical protein
MIFRSVIETAYIFPVSFTKGVAVKPHLHNVAILGKPLGAVRFQDFSADKLI